MHTSIRLLVSSLPTKERPAFSSSATISGFTCGHNNPASTNFPKLMYLFKHLKLEHYTEVLNLYVNKQTSYRCRCRSSIKPTFPYLKEGELHLDLCYIRAMQKNENRNGHKILEAYLSAYNLADIQSVTSKKVLLDPRCIVAPL